MENSILTLSNIFTVSTGVIISSIVLLLAIVWVVDRTQTKHTIRRNYPIFGRFRWFAEEAGVFIREYFINDESKCGLGL